MQYETSEMRVEADELIKKHALLAAGAGLIPVPIVDFVGIMTAQLQMTKHLCGIYGIAYREEQSKAVLSALSSTALALVGASLVKSIPLFGSIVGGVSASVLAGAATYASGEVLREHFSEGGVLDDLRIEDFKSYYKMQFERGKELIAQWQDERDAAPTADPTSTSAPPTSTKPTGASANTPDILQRLQQLAELRESGTLTEAEFKRLKAKLFDEFG